MSLANGQLAAAVVTLVDAVFGILVIAKVVAIAPSDSLVTIAVTVALNLGAYLLAYIQHSQHVTVLKLASQERMHTAMLERDARMAA
jgi:hypothetical protein